MRVLLVTDWITPEGGVESYVSWLRDALREQGDDVRLLTSSVGSAAYGTADYVAYGTRRTAPQVGLQIANPSAVVQMRRALRELRPDAVFVHMFEMHLSPAVLGPLRTVPSALMVHYYKPICPTGLKVLPDGTLCEQPAGLVCLRSGCSSPPLWLRDRPRYALIRRRLDEFDRILTVSRWMQSKLAEAGLAADTIALPVAAPGADFRRDPAEHPLFVYVGRLAPEKGIDTLLLAFARVRERHSGARLRLVGEGAERDRLLTLAAELGIADAVELAGLLAPADVPGEFARAWAVVVPSRTAEPGATVGLEALVHGVPVLAGEAGGLAEDIAPGQSGLLFRNGSVESMAGALESVAARAPSPIAPELVAEVMRRHGRDSHVEQLRGMFGELALSA